MLKTPKSSDEATGRLVGAASPAGNQANIVTVCAWSNTVRYEGDWLTFSQYLTRRFGLVATHGISPNAIARLEAEIHSESPAGDATRIGDQSVLRNPARLAALRKTGLLDSPPAEGFDRVTRLGARALNVPATFISLCDADRDFYLSNVGFGEPLATDRQYTGPTLCHFTIEREEPLVIPDTRSDSRYRELPTVELGVGAYLGAPLTLLSGQVIGSFCAIDSTPRQWTPSDIRCAQDLANIVVAEIELRTAIVSFCNAS